MSGTLVQWTPFIRFILEPTQSESYNRVNLISKAGKEMNKTYKLIIVDFFAIILILHIIMLLVN